VELKNAAEGGRMRFRFEAVKGWPKLAWLARGEEGSKEVRLYHGPCVELSETWCVEGVWAGEFREGGFDGTDLFAGSGVRVREGELVFVTAGNVMDRLWRLRRGGVWYVGNSLPLLLAGSGARLTEGFDYGAALGSIARGLDLYEREIPSSLGPIEPHYFQNLAWDGENWRTEGKPNGAPRLESFQDYYGFLERTARALGANSQAGERRHKVGMVVALSSGYDSSAAAVLARAAGCRQAVTIKTARSRLPHSDSGEGVARALGLECRTYKREPSRVRYEEEIWAAMGIGIDVTFTLFDYPGPVCLVFTGYYGDSLWDRMGREVRGHLVPRGGAGCRFGEFRLAAGVIFCSVAYWGIQRAEEIQRISNLPEMAPWTLGTDYDRPIPRRIVETAGVPRGAFAKRKLMSSFSPEIAYPFSRDLRRDFKRFARTRGYRLAGRWQILARRAGNLLRAVLRRMRVLGQNFPERPLPQTPADWFFRWAVERLRKRYEGALPAERSCEGEIRGCGAGGLE